MKKNLGSGSRISAVKRARIVELLKQHGGKVQTVAHLTNAAQDTVRRVRDAEGIAPNGQAGNILAPAVEKKIVKALTDDPTVSNGSVATAFGVDPETIKRVRSRNGIVPAPAPTARAPLDGSLEARERIALRDENTRLRRELEKAHRDALSEEAIKTIIGRMADFEPHPPRWLLDVPRRGPGGTPEVPVISFADWHFGEVVPLSESGGINEYNPKIAKERSERLVKSLIHLCRNHGPKVYPGAVVNLVGDFVSGGLHPELLKTDALEQIPSALAVLELLIAALDALLEEFGSLYVPCSSGNHGRHTVRPEFKRYVYKNFDWLIYQLLAKHYEAKGEKRIHFDIPDSNEVHYRVWGMRFLLMHGDMLGVKGGDGIIGSLGPIARGEVKVSKQASALGKDIDMLVIGHFHQDLWLPRVTVSNCLIGFNEFGMKAVRAVPAPPSQPLFFVHPTRGITSRWSVMVDEPKDKKASTNWVSFEAREVK